MKMSDDYVESQMKKFNTSSSLFGMGFLCPDMERFNKVKMINLNSNERERWSFSVDIIKCRKKCKSDREISALLNKLSFNDNYIVS